MQVDSADQLDVERHHVPVDRLPGDVHGRAEQAAACFANGRKRLGQEVVERGDDRLLPLVFRPLEILVDCLALDRVGAPVLGGAQALDVGPQGVGPLGKDAAEPGGLCLEGGLVHGGEARLVLANCGEHRLQPLDFAVLPRPEDCLDRPLDHPVPLR